MVYPVCTHDVTAVSQTVLPRIHGASRMYTVCIQNAPCSFLRMKCIQGVSRVCSMQGCAIFVSSLYPLRIQDVIHDVSDAVTYRMCIQLVSSVYPGCIQLVPRAQPLRVATAYPECIQGVSRVYPGCIQCVPVMSLVSQTVLPWIRGASRMYPGCMQIAPCSFLRMRCIQDVSLVCSRMCYLCIQCVSFAYPGCNPWCFGRSDVSNVYPACIQGVSRMSPARAHPVRVVTVYPECIQGVSSVYPLSVSSVRP
jgi:hypothetical protein